MAGLSTLVLLNLATGDETRYDADYEFAEEAAVLAFTTSTKDGSGDGAYVVPLDDVARRALHRESSQPRDHARIPMALRVRVGQH